MTPLTVNGKPRRSSSAPITRLSDVLRDEFALTGTKVGCEAGDCGACTVLLDGEQVCACMVPLAQAAGREVVTVEGLGDGDTLHALQQAFLDHGGAQCGACTPGMLIAAADLFSRTDDLSALDAATVRDALGGVLCRCTGYSSIVSAVLAAAHASVAACGLSALGVRGVRGGVGERLARVDGVAKVTGAEHFGADAAPTDALWMEVLRSPHARAHFELGDVEAWRDAHPGIEAVLTSADVPGVNGYGIYPTIKDQPVLADGEVRYRGEAVLALVGTRKALARARSAEPPLRYTELEPVLGIDAALADGATAVQPAIEDNVLSSGRLERGDARTALDSAAHRAAFHVETSFVEHAYIEPEAGFARRVGERVEIFVTTQSPYMDRDEVANVLGIAPSAVRIRPSACGGGFGGKLDQSVQPLLALAAWVTRRPVRCVWTRPESMRASTKRHPARIDAQAACDADGNLTAMQVRADFDTGAYASWGPTVADRVPVHCAGPYRVPNVSARSRAVLTNVQPSGAFRGFGVPQAALAHEALMDSLAASAGFDALEFRHRNALRVGDVTHTGQSLAASAGLAACIDALRPRWQAWRAQALESNARAGRLRSGVGIGCMWYGCGNTSMSNPSTMRIDLTRGARLVLYSGAVDIGQGVNTILVQVAAEALGVHASAFDLVLGDTDLTADAGKSSASRQTFVSGKAVELAARDLRARIAMRANANPDARIELRAPDEAGGAGSVVVTDAHDGSDERVLSLAEFAALDDGDAVLRGSGTFDPPSTPLNADGQGEPYGTYGFGAQIAEVEVDVELGTVSVTRIAAAHDVGRAVNPQAVEGQVHGGIAQGLGLALMEEFLPGRTENLHDYLIPTMGDMPDVEVMLIEDPEPLGPFGAKGVGEPALIPTAPAIMSAIEHATGVRPAFAPATPARLLAALRAARDS